MAGEITTGSILNTPNIVDPTTTYTAGVPGQGLLLNAQKQVVPADLPSGSGSNFMGIDMGTSADTWTADFFVLDMGNASDTWS